MGSSMKRRMGLIAARFRRQNAAPSASASSSFASSSLPNAASSSSFGSGARGLMSHVSSFFDGKGAYASLPHSTSADLKLDDDVQPPRPNSALAQERSQRVRKMGGATSPSSPPLGPSKFSSGGGKNNNLGSPIGIGMVDLDLSNDGGGSSNGGGQGFVAKPTPKQRTFDLQDEEEEDEDRNSNSETASMTKSFSKRI